jgi:hypothetical protein
LWIKHNFDCEDKRLARSSLVHPQFICNRQICQEYELISMQIGECFMAGKNDSQRFTLKNVFSYFAVSAASHWKPMLVAAPLIGTALFLASGTQAQTSGSATPSAPTSASEPVTPIASPEAARRKGPKIKEKEAMDTSRVANPPATTDAATPTQTGVPVAPIDSPAAARTGRPKERDPTPTNDRVANPTPATEPVAQPTERRRKGPKERDDDLHDTSRIETPAPENQPAGRRKGPKPRTSSDHQGRTSATPLIIGALGAATALALVVSSGNAKPVVRDFQRSARI